MMKSNIEGKRILVVDDEPDILETIEDILIDSDVETARDFQSAVRKIEQNQYDLAILDIMGVNGLQLLELTVSKEIPTVMLTAHAINPETLMESIRKGAISYLPKETLVELDDLLDQLLGAYEAGEPPWKFLFEKLDGYFNDRFGPGWQEKDSPFWSRFMQTYQLGEGIKRRLMHDPTLKNKGI